MKTLFTVVMMAEVQEKGHVLCKPLESLLGRKPDSHFVGPQGPQAFVWDCQDFHSAHQVFSKLLDWGKTHNLRNSVSLSVDRMDAVTLNNMMSLASNIGVEVPVRH